MQRSVHLNCFTELPLAALECKPDYCNVLDFLD